MSARESTKTGAVSLLVRLVEHMHCVSGCARADAHDGEREEQRVAQQIFGGVPMRKLCSRMTADTSAICEQLPQPGHVGFEIADRARQVGRRILVRAAVTSPQVPLILQGASRDGIHFPDDLGVGEAVGQDSLPVADGLRIIQAGQEH